MWFLLYYLICCTECPHVFCSHIIWTNRVTMYKLRISGCSLWLNNWVCVNVHVHVPLYGRKEQTIGCVIQGGQGCSLATPSSSRGRVTPCPLPWNMFYKGEGVIAWQLHAGACWFKGASNPLASPLKYVCMPIYTLAKRSACFDVLCVSILQAWAKSAFIFIGPHEHGFLEQD